MNNKPVAWMYRVNNSFNTFSTTEPPDDAYDEGTLIPLYTHPAELTDEEIKQIFVEESGFDVDTCPIAIMDFARAILRKAQEK